MGYCRRFLSLESCRTLYWVKLFQEDEINHRSRRAFSSIAYMVYNISYLNPLSTYWFRVRARNLVGSSDWTPVTTATTSDVRECAAIPRPLTLYYNSAQQKIDFEVVITGFDMKFKNQIMLIKFTIHLTLITFPFSVISISPKSYLSF